MKKIIYWMLLIPMLAVSQNKESFAVLENSKIEAQHSKIKEVANREDPKETRSLALTREISKFLKNPNFKVGEDETRIIVHFIINNEGAIVVLSVDTNNPIIDGFIKERLNYQKPNCDTNFDTSFFILPVKIVKS